jgi:hypothetical protein
MAAAVTFILTRNPLRTFTHGQQGGRWGQLIAVKGPKIKAVQLSAPGAGSNSGSGFSGNGSITIDTGVLNLDMQGGTITETKKYTSMERFRTNDGKGYYVQLHPKPEPYWITYEEGNPAVKELRKGHAGRCFRVHGGKQGPEQGILIHEAPHVGWLIGCISPRPQGNVTVEFPNDQTNPSYQSMNELFQFVGPARADLFVLDW